MSTFEVKTQAEIDALSLDTGAKGRAYFNDTNSSIVAWDGTAWRAYNSDGASYSLSSNTLSVDFTNTGNSSTNEWLQTDYQTTSSTGFTFSAWIKSSATAGTLFIDNYTGGDQLAFRTNGSNEYWLIYNGVTKFNTSSHSASGAIDGTWHHLALTMSGTTAEIYEDGSLAYTETVSSYAAIASNFRIGANNGNSATYDGLMDEVAFFDRVLTASQIYNQYNNKEYVSPDCHFRMGDGASDTDSSGAATAGGEVATITDISGNGHTATQTTATKKPVYSSDKPIF